MREKRELITSRIWPRMNDVREALRKSENKLNNVRISWNLSPPRRRWRCLVFFFPSLRASGAFARLLLLRLRNDSVLAPTRIPAKLRPRTVCYFRKWLFTRGRKKVRRRRIFEKQFPILFALFLPCSCNQLLALADFQAWCNQTLDLYISPIIWTVE